MHFRTLQVLLATGLSFALFPSSGIAGRIDVSNPGDFMHDRPLHVRPSTAEEIALPAGENRKIEYDYDFDGVTLYPTVPPQEAIGITPTDCLSIVVPAIFYQGVVDRFELQLTGRDLFVNHVAEANSETVGLNVGKAFEFALPIGQLEAGTYTLHYDFQSIFLPPTSSPHIVFNQDYADRTLTFTVGEASVTAVPLPPAVWSILLTSPLIALGYLRSRNRDLTAHAARAD